jgi:hypothetical protein
MELIAEHLRTAFNAHDMDAFRALLADDAALG